MLTVSFLNVFFINRDLGDAAGIVGEIIGTNRRGATAARRVQKGLSLVPARSVLTELCR